MPTISNKNVICFVLMAPSWIFLTLLLVSNVMKSVQLVKMLLQTVQNVRINFFTWDSVLIAVLMTFSLMMIWSVLLVSSSLINVSLNL